MLLKDVMTRQVETVEPDTTLRAAAQKMKRMDVGTMPVLEGHRLVGMVTDRDLAVRGVAEGMDPSRAKVKEVLTPEVVYGFEDQDVREAAELMREKRLRRLVVLNHEQRLVGIVSLGDLAVETQDNELSGETLEEISRPGRPKNAR